MSWKNQFTSMRTSTGIHEETKMESSAYDSAQIKPESPEELSRKLRRERIKLERNMSGGAGGTESPNTGTDNQAHVKSPASEAKTSSQMSDPTRVNDDPQSMTRNERHKKNISKCDAEEKEQHDVENHDACQQKTTIEESPSQSSPSSSPDTESKSQSSEPVLASPRSHADHAKSSPRLVEGRGQPSHLPPRSISNQKGKSWGSTVRQGKQKYDKKKSMSFQWKPKVSSNDLWLIRQTPKITGSYPDDEVSVYPDTMSVMSVDTQVRSNLITVEEVINEDGRTCYVI